MPHETKQKKKNNDYLSLVFYNNYLIMNDIMCPSVHRYSCLSDITYVNTDLFMYIDKKP